MDIPVISTTKVGVLNVPQPTEDLPGAQNIAIARADNYTTNAASTQTMTQPSKLVIAQKQSEDPVWMPETSLLETDTASAGVVCAECSAAFLVCISATMSMVASPTGEPQLAHLKSDY